ncbi:hypothetical protein NDU88_007052 [Pleurodeles waltl]|uniref:Uncharacterized protein n=1 Tax=Pleurodeles waltl TaxID=8319 RepID=A0AAV7QMK4_PLEWA|nr:hypothetical protein NDU88_007052 [Pleurodeles waltl]
MYSASPGYQAMNPSWAAEQRSFRSAPEARSEAAPACLFLVFFLEWVNVTRAVGVEATLGAGTSGSRFVHFFVSLVLCIYTAHPQFNHQLLSLSPVPVILSVLEEKG